MGTCLEELERVWKELTASEMRLNMMSRLQKIQVGFNDIENFNLGLIYNSKTLNHENYNDKDDKKVVEAAMNFKRKDEIRNRMKLIGEKIKMRKKIEQQLGKKSNKAIRLFQHLREESEKKRRELNDKYEMKIAHLRKKYEKDKETELDEIPEELEGFENLSIFSNEKYDAVKKAAVKAVKFGNIEIDEEEAEALKLHPKMLGPKNLSEGYINLPLDISYTKVRWQLRKEEECGGVAEDDVRRDEAE